jgi:archaemetzincin
MKYLYVGATTEVATDDDREALTAIRRSVAEEFEAPVRELELPDIEFARDAGRGQFASITVLEMLARICPADALKLVAVTGRDLFIPVLTFVYGHAQLGGQVAAISLARLRQEFYGLAPNRKVLLERARKEAMHETGHLFGLVHCQDRSCAMTLGTNIRQIDGKLAAFCSACRAQLRRRDRE